MKQVTDAIENLARRVRALETLRGVPSALLSARIVTGDSARAGATPLLVPVPRYRYHPDQLPATAAADDNEFDSASTLTTWINQGGAAASIADSHLLLNAPATVATNVRAVVRTISAATPRTFTARLSFLSNYQAFSQVGIALADTATTTRLTVFGPVYDAGITGGFGLGVANYPAPATAGAYAASMPLSSCVGVHLRVVDDGANLSYEYGDGYNWYVLLSQARNAYLLANGPVQVGVAANSDSSNRVIYASVDYLRKS